MKETFTKKVIMLLLIATLILSVIPINLVKAAPLNRFATDKEFYDYVELTLGTKYLKNQDELLPNRQTYNDYQQIVYGEQHGDKKKGETPWVKPGFEHLIGKMLPRHIGYDWNGDDVGNTHFTPDATSGTDPSKFNYISSSANTASWYGIHPDVMNHMLNAPLWGNGATSPFKTLNQLGGKAYGKPVSLATWLAEGGIYMQHKGASGKIWYVTQNVDSMLGSASGAVSGTITTPSNTYYIRKDETEVKIPVTVKADARLSGYAKATHIEEIVASFQGKADRKKGVTTVTTNQDFVATRSNYKVGTHQITLEGAVSLSTIFKDNEIKTVSKTVTLIVESEGDDPYVTTTVTPNPAEKRFENKDINVVLTVDGELHNYTKTSNIKEWVFWAREKEATSAVPKKEYTKSLTASTTFKFTIPASKIKEDNFKQYYVVRSMAYFKEKVNGKDCYEAPAQTVVVVYKDKPPVESPNPKPEPPGSNNLPPVTEITGPTVIQAGLPATYRAKSSDPDGYIETAEFRSSVPPFQETVEKIRYSFTKVFKLEDVGDVRMEHIVQDNEGAKASDFLIVEVTLPKPNAELSFGGKLKENRIVTMTNKSTSYGSPMNDEKTRITVRPYGDGATYNIVHLGSSPDNLTKNLTFKNRGIYEVEIYVENMIGESDSKTYYINIHPDMPPVADYNFDNKVYRDKYDNNFATMEITDLSYSPDSDEITEKIWTITYNANNSKDSDFFPNYSDDTSFQVKESELELFKEKSMVKGGFTYKFTKTAKDKLIIKANQVGNYLVELKVKENYGLEGDTNYKHKMEKTITIFNREPFVDFEP